MYSFVHTVLVLSLLLLFLPDGVEMKIEGKECEVCIATIEKFLEGRSSEQQDDIETLDKDFREFCTELPIHGKENRFCYFVGGTENAATGILGHLIRPLSYGVSPQNICLQLNAKDSQICELRYDVKPDFTKLNKMKVGELRKILSSWDESMACAGCAEKADYVKKVRELMPKHEPEEWKKLQEAEKAEL
uniref:Mesencephalic astrocyte-derived neurotrophic factor homolog n=1 Tax=Arion vulgaris TaxID=1028688 RepID=A0A0B6Z0R6_9EUPU